MRIAILDPFSGIAGDMFLGALVDAGLDAEFVERLPAVLGIEGVGVEVRKVSRGQIACHKVDFTIPPQPHGRHLKHIRAIVEATPAPASVKDKAMQAFALITECEAAIHGTTVERVHLHEVGSVDAILDIVGSIWGLERLGVERVHCGTLPLGDGFVDTAHGRMAVPTAATLKLLEGLPVRPGPEGSGELVTPTGAALVRVLSVGPAPDTFTPRASGFGAGTKEFADRANALRIVIADADGRTDPSGSVADASTGDDAALAERLIVLAADIDDATGEQLGAVADLLRDAGARDVALIQTIMKKGRPGARLEVLADHETAGALEEMLLRQSTTIGVRSYEVDRRALPREHRDVEIFGQPVGLKIVTLPDGTRRVKPEFDDVIRASLASGRSLGEIAVAASKIMADG